MAWHYKQYSKDRELASAEVVARKERLSLWDDKSPVAPWEWRKGNRNQNANAKPKDDDSHGLLYGRSVD